MGTTQSTGSDAPYIVDHDTVVAAETPAQGQGPCSLQNRFLHGQKVVFRVKVVDPATGDQLTGDDLSGVTVNVESGSAPTLDMEYGPHPPKNPTDEYWVVAWTVPDGFPAGPVEYAIEVAGDHPAKTVSFNVPPSNLVVLEGTYSPPTTSGGNESSS